MNTFKEIKAKLEELKLENPHKTVSAMMCEGCLQFIVSNTIVLETTTTLKTQQNCNEDLIINKAFDDEFDFLNDEPQIEIFLSEKN